MSRWLLTLLGLTILAGSNAATANGALHWGSRYLNTNCCTLYGGRANIDQTTLSPSSALTAAVVNANNQGAYLIEAGFIKTSGVGWNDCLDVSSRARFYEALTPNGKWCNAYSNTSVTRAAVLWSSAGPTTWSAWLDGTRVFRADVGFGGAQEFSAAAELNGSSGSVSTRFGAGDTPWQRATGRDGFGYYTIQQSYVLHFPSGEWSIGPLPSPFTISGP